MEVAFENLVKEIHKLLTVGEDDYGDNKKTKRQASTVSLDPLFVKKDQKKGGIC